MLSKKKRLGLVSLLSGFLFLSLAGVIWYFRDVPIISPVTSETIFSFISGRTAKNYKASKIVYGFLPYWNLRKAHIQPELTHVGYFSLGIGPDGTLLSHRDGQSEPGFQKLNSPELATLLADMQAAHPPIVSEVVLTQFNSDEIVAFLSSTTAQNTLLRSLDGVLLAYPFSGVNLDIEYGGQITEDLRQSLTRFVSLLRTHLNQKYPTMHLTIDVYASGSDDRLIWDLPALTPLVDHFIVMAYDFHRRSSIQAGPVAPLFGGKQYWDSDITQHLQGFLQVVPKNKILLGIPFYGYEWQTVTLDPLAQTFPNTGATASIERVQTLLSQKKLYRAEEHWNEAALSPYVTYVQDKKNWVIYYENSRSLSYKLDLVNQLGLGGIAIWALGYEGSSRELWEVVEQKL